MKPIIIGATILSILCCAETSRARQSSIAPAGVPAPPGKPVPVARQAAPELEEPSAPEAPLRVEDENQRQNLKLQEELNRTKAQFDQARAQFERGMSSYAAAQSTYPDAFTYWGGSSHADRSMVIRISDTDPKVIAAMEEDLNIMSRILEKALVQNGDDVQPKAMSIPLVTYNSHSHLRNLEIEGFGAVFFLNVNFPLAGPASNKSEESAKEPTNSTWDEAKRELYGPPSGSRGQPNGASLPKEDYDPRRVEKLKDSLLDALKNGSNMRNLKSDENVTVVVTHNAGNDLFRYTDVLGTSSGGGGGGIGSASAFLADGSGRTLLAEKPARRIGNGNGNGSTMTIRAKKSEIDAFASGKMNLEEFRNKAKVLVY